MQKLSMDELQRTDVESFKKQEKTPITIVMDNVRSMHNVGSAFRTADGFAIEKIYLCGITGTPPHREIEKTALGATQSVAWEYHKDTTAVLISFGQKVMSLLPSSKQMIVLCYISLNQKMTKSMH
jgi:tRNA G18 (ribose-2'-O)-methylase SpoU